LLGSQAYGLKYLVDHLPAFVPAREWVIHNLVPVLQPGLWGNLILLGLAAHRVRDLRGRTAARPGEPSGTDSGSTPR
jgi:hypothetical protein